MPMSDKELEKMPNKIRVKIEAIYRAMGRLMLYSILNGIKISQQVLPSIYRYYVFRNVRPKKMVGDHSKLGFLTKQRNELTSTKLSDAISKDCTKLATLLEDEYFQGRAYFRKSLSAGLIFTGMSTMERSSALSYQLRLTWFVF